MLEIYHQNSQTVLDHTGGHSKVKVLQLGHFDENNTCLLAASRVYQLNHVARYVGLIPVHQDIQLGSNQHASSFSVLARI